MSLIGNDDAIIEMRRMHQLSFSAAGSDNLDLPFVEASQLNPATALIVFGCFICEETIGLLQFESIYMSFKSPIWKPAESNKIIYIFFF